MYSSALSLLTVSAFFVYLLVAALEDLLEQIDASFSYSSEFTLERNGDQIELLQNGVALSNDRLVTLVLNDYLTNEFA